MRSGVWRGSVAVLVGAAVVFGAVPAVAAPPGGSFTIEQDSGPPGTLVDAQIDCGDASETGWRVVVEGGDPLIELDRVESADQVTTTAFTIPPDAPAGAFPLHASCVRLGGVFDTIDVGDPVFTVVAPPVPPPSVEAAPVQGEAGDEVVLTGDSLPACPETGWGARFGTVTQAVTVRSITPIETIAISETRYRGEFTTTVPNGLPAGATTVGLGCNGQVLATTAFEVTAPPVTTTTPRPVVTTDPVATTEPTVDPTTAPIALPTPPAPPADPPVASVALVLVALVAAGLVGLAVLRRAGREWAARHVQVVARQGSVRR